MTKNFQVSRLTAPSRPRTQSLTRQVNQKLQILNVKACLHANILGNF